MASSNGKETDLLALTESYKPGWLDDADKRRKEVNAVIAAREALIRDLGGDLSVQKEMIVDRVIFLHLRLTTLERKFLDGGEIDWQHFTYVSNVFVGLLAKVGLERIPKQVATLSQYSEFLARRDSNA